MTEFVLVRHGETDWNLQRRLQGSVDIPLNDTGIAQARAVAAHLASDHWDAVISSPLQRAYETAIQIVDPLGIAADDIVLDARLQERHFGLAEGLDFAERSARWPDHNWPEAETLEIFDARIWDVLEHLANRYEGKRVVVVTHGGWIRGAIYRASGGDLDVVHSAVIPNASCTYISHAAEGWHLGEIGIAEHAPIVD